MVVTTVYMFCVIQTIERKKPPGKGYSKKLIAEYSKMSFNGEDMSHWSHHYSYDYFERTIKKAYKISIHHSYRENGMVKKKQFVLATVDYYEIAENFFCLYDYCDRKIEEVAKKLNVTMESIYELVERKLDPLEIEIKDEFMKTEEYKVHEEHERITTVYAAKKVEFNSKYDLSSDSSVYDKCYDVFGTLRNPEVLEQIKREYKSRKEYEERSRSYQKEYHSNYNNYNSSSSFNSNQGNYKEEHKQYYKEFYKELSRKFHPDSNPDKDTSEQMKLVNQLKDQWNI